ncbi:MAG: ligase-associated DNA damage response endonuclease PdeM, partial [Hyphomicrobiales bacterium]|nr:ligase-associated DNA damage response endonuclease PdeM [Hyphomicrobiales bacterium]
MPAVVIAGEPVVFDPAGALWWPRAAMLVVADLHLEKGSSLAGRGHLLPPYDSAATLAALSALIEAYRPDRVVALGDSFHDCGGPERLSVPDRECLLRLSERCDWIWIAGNHDPEIGDDIGGSQIAELAASPFVFRHAPEPGRVPGEIAGHLHPAAKLNGRGRSLRRRCFATDGTRVILPAFGAYTGG